jgi:PAS domain S-box-containing protein
LPDSSSGNGLATQLADVRARLADSERRLAAQLDELERLYATTPVGLAVIDGALRYRRVNRMLAETNGASVEAHLGRTVFEMVPDLAAKALVATRRVIETGEPLLGLEFVGETRARPGEPRHFVEHWYPVRDASGEVVAAGVVVQDVTDRHRAEAALREADARKDEFLAMLAHELRNPLAPLRTSLRTIEREPLSGQGRAALAVCGRQVHHLTRLVEDLLDVSRAARGKIALRIGPVTVQHVVRTVVDALGPQLEERGLSLVLSMPAEPARIEADAVRIAQILENLLSNASKYTDPGGRIAVSVVPGEQAVTVVVRDTGIGIAAEHLPRLFEPFTQVDTAIDRSRGGLGIGLALVSRLVGLHGGTVAAHSDGPGRGSTFTVTLPRRAASVTPPGDPTSGTTRP